MGSDSTHIFKMDTALRLLAVLQDAAKEPPYCYPDGRRGGANQEELWNVSFADAINLFLPEPSQGQDKPRQERISAQGCWVVQAFHRSLRAVNVDFPL